MEPISGAVYKGVITCDFTLPMVMKSGRTTKTDFKNGKYYILLATGGNNKEPHGPGSVFMNCYETTISSVTATCVLLFQVALHITEFQFPVAFPLV